MRCLQDAKYLKCSDVAYIEINARPNYPEKKSMYIYMKNEEFPKAFMLNAEEPQLIEAILNSTDYGRIELK